ncbi:MAG: hypothetical protein LBL69_01060, partial [Zoogloeaceae bacterium]|nr:hypothetical protein [Zoogloeaceae bacterium]
AKQWRDPESGKCMSSANGLPGGARHDNDVNCFAPLLASCLACFRTGSIIKECQFVGRRRSALHPACDTFA